MMLKTIQVERPGGGLEAVTGENLRYSVENGCLLIFEVPSTCILIAYAAREWSKCQYEPTEAPRTEGDQSPLT